MKEKKVIGFLFIILSMILSVSQLKITGAFIGAAVPSYLISVSIGAFFIGTLYLLGASLQERLVRDPTSLRPHEIADRINKIIQGDGVTIMDTSAIIPLTYKGVESLLNKLNSSGSVVVPDSVIQELSPHGKKNPVVDLLKAKSIHPREDARRFYEQARKLLQTSEKAQLYTKLSPHIKAVIKTNRAQSISNREFEEITKLMPILLRVAKGDKYLLDIHGDPLVFCKKCDDYLETHCKVSETDVEVLANQLAERKAGKKAVVLADDRDFSAAITSLGDPDAVYVNSKGRPY